VKHPDAIGNHSGATVGRETKPAAISALALNQRDAAAALGVAVDTFAEHVAPTLRRVKCGRLWLYPGKELDRWLDRRRSSKTFATLQEARAWKRDTEQTFSRAARSGSPRLRPYAEQWLADAESGRSPRPIG
jgi:hypothetical protein